MSLVFPTTRIRERLRKIEEDTTKQRVSAAEQLREVAKIVGQAEIVAHQLREAAETFTNRERPEGLK